MKQDIETLMQEIKELEKEIKIIDEKRSGLVCKLGEKIKLMKEEKTRIQQDKIAIYRAGLKQFKEQPTHKQAIQLIRQLYSIDFASLESSWQLMVAIEKEQLVLFEYLLEKGDVQLIEKYLLAKTATSGVKLAKIEEQVVEYKKHFSKDGDTHTDRSRYQYQSHDIYAWEIQEFVKFLARRDADEGIYLSCDFQKYLMRAVVGAYGWWGKYLYCDGEYGHMDYVRHCLRTIYDTEHETETKKIYEM